MTVLVFLCAAMGFLALGFRLLGSLLGLGLTAAEASAANSLAEASARRGDLTGMMERKEAAGSLRRRRIRSLGWVSLWGGLLLVPPMLDLGPLVYSAAALLWVMPGGRVRVGVQRMR